jgi:hypothetical protein
VHDQIQDARVIDHYRGGPRFAPVSHWQGFVGGGKHAVCGHAVVEQWPRLCPRGVKRESDVDKPQFECRE